jgi:hypothetical protein
MVDAIKRVSGSSAPSPTWIDSSTSIEADPDHAWVAARQSQMTAELLGRRQAGDHHDENEDVGEIVDTDSAQEQNLRQSPSVTIADDDDADTATLSGESGRIGTRNFDEDTPFGERVAIV